MEITEIIKESFIFPANNLKALAIYIAITFVMGILVAGGIFSALGIQNSALYGILSFILFIIAVLVGFILSGYEIDIIKTGIDLEDLAPDFDWKADLIRGIKAIIVAIVYFIIPAIITLIVAFITNVPGNFVNVVQYVNQTAVNTNGTVVANSVLEMVPKSVMSGLVGSISITLLVAAVLFIIFSFIQVMANSRLANTDSLGEALNIPEAVKDISRIGVGKVLATLILVFIVSLVIGAILSAVYQQVPQLSILNIIVTPYLMFFTNRATGLLYSDIA
ncbi:MAG: DUF4013 domain-containing protein [Methanobrevibacter sp.]|uniref:DUF4013 domain-containing protein n=1 Tax=Methanobrevibacter sp. TaxID=66852 RepID=UPI0025FE05F6|nr:DUF4013 domain-containing protein [Methanobrevibacter sp.]MBR3112408.1 DUF4013 domain-containing protein [Methanobrevibacter sp.]MBR6992975.1 DUF4013 domain-containing protein [Methanobrevibacter sp.]